MVLGRERVATRHAAPLDGAVVPPPLDRVSRDLSTVHDRTHCPNQGGDCAHPESAHSPGFAQGRPLGNNMGLWLPPVAQAPE
jgi:hypothetical protein